jgi:anaerobic selenocysteine-containing dehydrogenase
MNAIADGNARYRGAGYASMLRTTRQPTNGATTQAFHPIERLAVADDGLVMLSGRDLYTNRQAAAANLGDADRIGRGEYLEIHPSDAAARNLKDGATVRVTSDTESISMVARITGDVPEGVVFVPIFWNRGAVQALLRSDATLASVEVSQT